MDGTEYRCIVSQTDLSTEKSSVVYSNTVSAPMKLLSRRRKPSRQSINRGIQPTRSIKMRTLEAIKSQAMFSAAVTVLAIIIIRG